LEAVGVSLDGATQAGGDRKGPKLQANTTAIAPVNARLTPTLTPQPWDPEAQYNVKKLYTIEWGAAAGDNRPGQVQP